VGFDVAQLIDGGATLALFAVVWSGLGRIGAALEDLAAATRHLSERVARIEATQGIEPQRKPK